MPRIEVDEQVWDLAQSVTDTIVNHPALSAMSHNYAHEQLGTTPHVEFVDDQQESMHYALVNEYQLTILGLVIAGLNNSIVGWKAVAPG
jgi:hypothetical protein